jgi:hypothetical protein
MDNRLRLKLTGMVLLAIAVTACGSGGATTTTPPNGETTGATAPEQPELWVKDGTVSLNGETYDTNEIASVGPGDEIAVQGVSVGLVRVPDLFSFELFKNGSIALDAWDNQRITAVLNSGHVEFEFLGPTEAQLHLQTPQGTVVETLGEMAVFTACQPESGLTCLTVENGSVTLTAGGKSTTYQKGESTATGAFLNEGDRTPSESICIPDQEFEEWSNDARHFEDTKPLGAFVATYPLCTSDGPDRIDVELSVPGTEVWTDTGRDLKPGDLVVMEATGDVILGGGGIHGGPEGNDDPNIRTNNVEGLENENHGALIGRIGEGTPFLVGADHGFAVEEEGRLFLGINDTGIENNSGAFQVVITIVPS